MAVIIRLEIKSILGKEKDFDVPPPILISQTKPFSYIATSTNYTPWIRIPLWISPGLKQVLIISRSWFYKSLLVTWVCSISGIVFANANNGKGGGRQKQNPRDRDLHNMRHTTNIGGRDLMESRCVSVYKTALGHAIGAGSAGGGARKGRRVRVILNQNDWIHYAKEIYGQLRRPLY